MSTFLRWRTVKYGLIFLAWAAVVGFISMVDQVPLRAAWPYTAWLRFLELPGVALIVSAGAIHGFGSYWMDDSIIILGSALFWFLVTITLMAIWSAICRLLSKRRS